MRHIHVTKWGNSLGFCIPHALAESMNIEVGDTLELTSSEDGLLVKKAELRSKRYALANILDSFTSAMEHPAIDFGKSQGEEIW